MTDTAMIEWVFSNNKFDADWYRNTYPDVDMLGMDPAYHFRTYGAMMGRAPSAQLAADPHLPRAKAQAAPFKNGELKSAHALVQEGGHDLAISYAQLHVPQERAYTIDTLRANQALAKGDEAGWLHHLNIYIDHFGAAPVILGEGEQLLDRFGTAPLPAVTGGPLISVIMPAWNAEGTIRAAARSVLNQTWRNLELLIVDDASQDGTWGEMQEIAAGDSRVKIYRNKVNVGPYVSKNTLLSMAGGEWITGHDADDWAHPQRLEQHMAAILKSPTPPRASVPYMLRLGMTGMVVRFGRVANHSHDGIARLSSIACMFNAGFLRDDLGGWDCIRFGADSEMMARAQARIGDEFAKFPQISMLCMELEDSLTNHPELGVDPETGPSLIRKEYSEAWRKWHKTLANNPPDAHLEFPPKMNFVRPFKAPANVCVPICDIRRNHAALTGKDEALDEAVTAICSSRRPAFLAHIANQLCQQSHKNLHVIYVAHGAGHDLARIEQAFAGVASVKVLALPDPSATLGEALNLALDHCRSDLVTKIDDDDFYGPDYIRSSIAALKYNGNDGVGIVGRAYAYCFVEAPNMLALRMPERFRNSLRQRVFGGTIFWSRSKLKDQRFQLLPRAVDTAFFADAVAQKVSIYGCEPYDYVHVRYARLGEHTWQIDAEEFLSKATPVAEGLRLDLAFSTQVEPQIMALPKHEATASPQQRSAVPAENLEKFPAGTSSGISGQLIQTQKDKLKPLPDLAGDSHLTDISFRSGFVVRPVESIPEFINHWKVIRIGKYQVIRNPDCALLDFSTTKGRALILGEIFVCHGNHNLKSIVSEIIDFDRIELLDSLSGRFAIIAQRDDNIWIANDPFGSRTIYFSNDASQPGIASHSALLAAVISKPDRKDIACLINDESYKRRGTVYLPGHATRFQNVIHITPNCRYFLNSGQLHRYWPVKDIEPTSVSEFIDLVNEYFIGLSSYLRKSGKATVLGLTGGLDARSIVAATRHHGVSPILMTWTGRRLDEAEIPIVERMITYLSERHVYIDPNRKVASDYDKKLLAASNLASGGHRGPSRLSLAMKGDFSNNANFIRGFGGEIIRGFYNRSGRNISREMRLDDICKNLNNLYLTSKNKNCSSLFREISLAATTKFVCDTDLLSAPKSFDLFDLFYWEQRMGTWAANMHNEDDIAMFSMTGINSRKVFLSSFGLPTDQRVGRQIMSKITASYDEHFSRMGVVS